MENFQGYRDDLAKNLKEIRKTDKGKAQNVLNEASNTEEYKAAKADRIDIHEQIKIQDDFERMDKERARFNREVIEHSQTAEENSDIEHEENIKAPEIGGKIYVPSSGSFSSPKEDVAGGLATINTIEKIANGDYIITVIEHPNPKYQYSLKKLLSEQDDLMNTYKGKIAKTDSDENVYSENDWKRNPNKDDGGWVQSK